VHNGIVHIRCGELDALAVSVDTVAVLWDCRGSAVTAQDREDLAACLLAGETQSPS